MTAIIAKPSSIALRRPKRTPINPAGSAPITPPIAQAMKPIVTSSARTPKRSVPCSANHVVNVWKVSCSSSDATKIARMPGHDAAHGGPQAASSSDRNVASAARRLRRAAARAAQTRSATAIASTVPAAIRNAVRIPSIRPSIRKTIAPTHIWNVTDPVASER